MIVLKTVKRYQTLVGVCSRRLSEPTNEFLKSFQFYVFYFAFVGPLCAGSLAYLFHNFSDLTTSTNAFIVLTAGVSGAGSYAGMGANMQTIKRLYNEIQRIVDKEQKTDAFRCYEKAENKSHLLTKWFSILVISFFTFGCGGIPIICSVIKMWNGDYDTFNWFLPYYMLVPFDTSTVFGWYLKLFCQLYSGYAYVLTMTSTVTYFGSCCFYIEACCSHFKLMFDELDVIAKERNQNAKKMQRYLCEAVEFHIKILKLFEMLSQISSCAIFFQLLCNVVFFSSAIFQMEMSLSRINLFFFFNVLCMFEGLSYTFILCYFATSATSLMTNIGSVIYISNWHHYPLHLRKYSLLIIGRSQRIVYCTGFKIVRCTLESFTKLTNTAASYYIMFRKVSNR